MWALDTEVYKDYFLVMMRNIETGEVRSAELIPGGTFRLAPMTGTIITFNGNNFDMPLLGMAMAGADCVTIKAGCDDIILGGLKPWHIRDKYSGVPLEHIDHIDLIEVAPGQCGLKAYGGRLHSKRLQDLPIEPSASISPGGRLVLREYCANDLRVTEDLYRKLIPQIELRVAMSAEYGMDLRSKSDAQIAEAVIRSEVEKLLGKRVYRPEIHPAYRFKYKIPSFVAFNSPRMNHVLDIIRGTDFAIDKDGAVEMPKVLESMRLRIGAGVYRMGVGGLHSSESCASHVASAATLLIDRDVTSYYPAIILTQGLYPSHLGEAFLSVYRSLVNRRLAAKHSGNKVLADMLKIVINGSFGKLGSKWSVLYSPDLLVQVTLTGQLALLMLIEALEDAGFPVVSANTDGVVIKCPTERKGEMDALVSAWEMVSGFTTEETEYGALYSKDVNNYVAIKSDGSAKCKGLYTPAGLQKNNTNAVCVEAAIGYLANGVAVRDHVLACSDIGSFVTIRQVKGGAEYGGGYLGKVVRWYYAKDETRCVTYKSNGNKVARSEGCRPLMELPDTLPADLDYEWYIQEAESILDDIGVP